MPEDLSLRLLRGSAAYSKPALLPLGFMQVGTSVRYRGGGSYSERARQTVFPAHCKREGRSRLHSNEALNSGTLAIFYRLLSKYEVSRDHRAYRLLQLQLGRKGRQSSRLHSNEALARGTLSSVLHSKVQVSKKVIEHAAIPGNFYCILS